VSWAVKALVEATPISGPALVVMVPCAVRVMAAPTTLQMARVLLPFWMSSRWAASGDVYIVETNLRGASTPYTVQAFAANATGSVAATRTFTGGAPTPNAAELCDLAVDASGNIYVVQLAPSTTDQLISVFSSTANGTNVAPANSFIMPGMFPVGFAVQ